jgi:hypothetical protein
MTDQNGWPDASKPGVPMNPERDGWHWVDSRAHGLHALEWNSMWRGSACGWWHGSTSADTPSEFATLRDLRYLGPCHTPAEVAAMLAKAEQRGMERAAKMLSARADAIDAQGLPHTRGMTNRRAVFRQAAAAIRAALAEETDHD